MNNIERKFINSDRCRPGDIFVFRADGESEDYYLLAHNPADGGFSLVSLETGAIRNKKPESTPGPLLRDLQFVGRSVHIEIHA